MKYGEYKNTSGSEVSVKTGAGVWEKAIIVTPGCEVINEYGNACIITDVRLFQSGQVVSVESGYVAAVGQINQ
jgi:hypothetical protein